jgi:hypothetical protein
MMDKINVIHIVAENHETLRSYETGKHSVLDILLFYIFPLSVGFVAWRFGLDIDKDRANATIAAASIFAGLLINVLVLIYTVAQKAAESTEKTLVRQFFSNVSYAILLSVITVVLLTTNLLLAKPFVWMSAVVVALCVQFCLVLLMSIKRLHALLKSKIE